MLTSYLLFFFAGLGTFNGVALSVYLLCRRPATPAHRWLAALVLMLSLRTGKSILFYFWPDISKLVLQVGLTACFFIGICLIGFVRAWRDPEGRQSRNDALVAVGLAVLATALGFIWPYADNVQPWAGPVWASIQVSWLICLLAATALFKGVGKQTSATEPILPRRQVAAVIAGVALIWLAYATAGMTSYIVGALSFSLVLYLSISVALARRRVPTVNERYRDRKIDQAEADASLRALHALMADEAAYRDASLTLAKLAKRLNMPQARLSQLLNDNHKTAFKPYLAQVRIEAAKQVLRTQATASMEHVAEACGFLSASTFHSCFKKVEGTTPGAWRQAQVNLDAGS